MLDERPDEFQDRNLFFQAILGLVSLCRRLDVALDPVSTDEPAPADEPFLLFMLGLVAFRQRAMRSLETAGPDPSRPPAQCAAESVSLHELLR
ncbi:hypothetical protein WME76_12335 [Sorangium sp. So ce119]|uniref:hypothetical protein n=1 Tax=Sorangium sp. So ce119 TaxID=3133279 RepID=UPI003F6262AD